jgi:uracil-DNA glycosylase
VRFETSEGITRLRGRWLDLQVDGHACPAMATFHPAALLRMPLNKRFVWRDMLAVAERLEQIGAGHILP